MSAEDMRRGIVRLTKRLDDVKAFDPNSLSREDPHETVRPLSTSIETALVETFGSNTIEYNRYWAASQFDWPISFGDELPHHDKVRSVSADRVRSIQLLGDAISLLQERLGADEEVAVRRTAKTADVQSNRIFVVHGHDSELKESVARWIAKLGYEPIILHEQANVGRTIIQKFRDEAADVGFAIVLLTPDDELPNGKKRARQNVILELGFFLGALGPNRVASLVRGDVETPNDFDGVLYTPVDGAGMWKFALAKELKAAGYQIDMNIAL
ncbi:Predicted nucleotide-binding protein containing TIR-like domain-containing protein [Kaistia soli DSM 19436]|uniref:Predicted nucleotide-binding protein containing TIR-like domain-containing protein n=1 Tax=Kaistia soli DSM 19436 TaxID=1122133 RepID=A0A1M5D273_9HYPH|nr:nucleotide-binding protein [Kaistia soli]SHF61078.1 Predicted nucleotide-binding protein containing TIR-like domain-containing protein [Kaistia soli DSM 19436]